jgi:hypothetical protein
MDSVSAWKNNQLALSNIDIFYIYPNIAVFNNGLLFVNCLFLKN